MTGILMRFKHIVAEAYATLGTLLLYDAVLQHCMLCCCAAVSAVLLHVQPVNPALDSTARMTPHDLCVCSSPRTL